jgi:RNA polymerase sigma-70 factor (ECF subfamily)
VASLSSRDARVVALIAGPTCRPADIAAALGISPGAAKVVVHRARRRLAAAVESEWPIASGPVPRVAGLQAVR